MAQDKNKKQNDEDLLILSSDDEDSGVSELVLDGDSTPLNNEISNDDTNNEAVLFDTVIEDAPKTEENEAHIEESANNSAPDNFTLTFDSTNDDSSEEVAEESNSAQNGFNFDLAGTSASVSDEGESMVDILSGTIEKFQKRGEKIDTNITKVENDTKDLKAKIEQLEGQVKEKDEEKQKLVSEKTALDKNIKGLEKMKADSDSGVLEAA